MLEQEKAPKAVARGGTMRPVINGTPTVQAGRLIHKGITEYEYAKRLKDALAIDFPDFTYAVTGVFGDYRIIEYDKERSTSNYVD